jgi:hypothetical protein
MANTSKWGPNIWQTLHFISLGYPDNPSELDKEKYKNFFLLFQYILPCKICSNHYSENLQKNPITDKVLSSKNNLILWVIDIHNQVNISLGKPELSLDEVLDIYGNLDPISPFAAVDTIAIAKKHEIKRYTKLYYWLVIMAIVIIASRFYFNRYYFSF